MQLDCFVFPTMALLFSLPVFGLPTDTKINVKRQLVLDPSPPPKPMANPPPLQFGPAQAASLSSTVKICRHERFQECSTIEMTYQKCYGPSELQSFGVRRNEMTSYSVKGGCCSFFESDDCGSKFMFDAYNRQDERLGNHHNDKMNSVRCQPQCHK
ncbi:hypothetical protein BZA77DRAFT_289767 [Pyronema omphalodes]|nr:hypothetical protein BZA77DRAFT_289767 [Pyronema omphalodes]